MTLRLLEIQNAHYKTEMSSSNETMSCKSVHAQWVTHTEEPQKSHASFSYACGSYGIIWLRLRTDLKPLCCTNLISQMDSNHMLQFVCELICIFPGFSMKILWLIHPTHLHATVYSVNTLHVTEVRRWTGLQVPRGNTADSPWHSRSCLPYSLWPRPLKCYRDNNYFVMGWGRDYEDRWPK